MSRALCLALLLLLPVTASAAVARKMDLPQLAAAADVILVGQVQKLTAVRHGGRIVTHATVAPERFLKGTPTPSVTVEVAGGELDGLGQRVPGEARFVEGERVVLFLEEPASATVEGLLVVGLAQGKLSVQPTEAGPIVQWDPTDLVTVQPASDGTLTPSTPALPLRQPLNDLLNALDRALATPPR